MRFPAVLLLAAVILPACGSWIGPRTGGPVPDWSTPELMVSVDEVMRHFDANADFILVDARPRGDWRRHHLPSAVSVPYFAINLCDEAMQRDTGGCFGLPKDRWLVTYCACPHSESEHLALGLIERGYTRVKVIEEGFMPWLRRGWPMEEGIDP